MNALRVSLDKHPRTGTRIAAVIVVASGLIAGEHFVKTDDCNPGSSHRRSALRLRDGATHQDQEHKHGRQHNERSAGTAKAARVEASEHIKAVVGEQKLQVLTAFLNELEIAALAGKGYPAPADLDTGITPKKTAPRRHKK